MPNHYYSSIFDNNNTNIKVQLLMEVKNDVLSFLLFN